MYIYKPRLLHNLLSKVVTPWYNEVDTSPQNTKYFPYVHKYPEVIAVTLRQLCKGYGAFGQLGQIVTISTPMLTCKQYFSLAGIRYQALQTLQQLLECIYQFLKTDEKFRILPYLTPDYFTHPRKCRSHRLVKDAQRKSRSFHTNYACTNKIQFTGKYIDIQNKPLTMMQQSNTDLSISRS